MAIRDPMKLLSHDDSVELFKEAVPNPTQMQLRNNRRWISRQAGASVYLSRGSTCVNFDINDPQVARASISPKSCPRWRRWCCRWNRSKVDDDSKTTNFWDRADDDVSAE